jgi:hypothetical protein
VLVPLQVSLFKVSDQTAAEKWNRVNRNEIAESGFL